MPRDKAGLSRLAISGLEAYYHGRTQAERN
jgi:hypothetical protein